MSLRTLALRAAKAYMASRPPDFEIGPPEDRYLRRWIVFPWGRGNPYAMSPLRSFLRKFPNLYLHQIRHDDEDRALHDHPFASVSWLLENGYTEMLFYPMTEAKVAAFRRVGADRPSYEVRRPEGAIVFRRASAAHRLVLDKVPERLGRTNASEVVSAFFVGFRTRSWFFHCPKRLVPWFEFVDARDRGAVGKGCGD